MEELRARKRLDAREKIDMVMKRFGPLRQGKRMPTLQQLKSLYFPERDPSVISRAITSAFKEGLVAVVEVRQPSASLPVRKPLLEKALLKIYRDLHGAIVIDDDDDSLGQREAGDRLHEKLGLAMAEALSSGSMFRDGDVIGLGSGRGVYYTVAALESLTRVDKLRTQSLTLVSLTGDMHVRDHSKQLNFVMDANDHISILGRCFGPPIGLHKVYSRGVFDPQGAFTGPVPDIALVGVGALVEGHRLFDFEPTDRDDPLFDERRDIQELVRLSSRLTELYGGEYCPVGDISNYLFYVPPPRGRNDVDEGIRDQLVSELKKYIKRLNKKLVTIQEDQLADVNTIILVAGTAWKRQAIHSLLTGGADGEMIRTRIRHLCTDRTTAEELIDMNG